MKRVLIYKGKHGDELWDVTTLKQLEKARKQLFKWMDKTWQMFDFIERFEEKTVGKKCDSCGEVKYTAEQGVESNDWLTLKSARKGAQHDIEKMLDLVKHHEYGFWDIVDVQ